MTTLKKTILYLGVPVLATLISLPFWPEQYGDSYSEQQRKIWNTQMRADPTDQFRTDLPSYYSGKDAGIKHIVDINNKSSRLLQKQAAPDRNVTPPDSPDLSKLPPEGMTFEELLHHAETNRNPDSYLLILSTSQIFNLYSFSTKQNFQSMRRWISKAHQLERPGSEFLLRAVDQREETTTVADTNKKVNAVDELQQMDGFNEFKQLIDSGDFALYKALVAIWPDAHRTSIGADLEAMLERKARQGYVIARRQLGEYGLMNLNDLSFTIFMEKHRPRSSFMLWLSKKAEEWCPDLITISKTMDSSPTRDKLNDYAAHLKKAAEAGDLPAMCLWLQYGVETLNHYSREDWNDILRYSDILITAGYEQAYPKNWGSSSRSREVLQRSYSLGSIKRLISDCLKTLSARGSECQLYSELRKNKWEDGTRQYNLELLDRAERQNPSRLIGSFFEPPSIINNIKDPVAKQRYVDIIRKEARDGDSFFMSALSNMIRNKLAEPEEPEEAIRLLEQAWDLRHQYNTNAYLLSDEYFSHTAIVVDGLMELYLMDFPSPENQRKAFQLAHQYLLSDGDRYTVMGYYRKLANFYLSLMHQKGYGTPKNNEKAQYYHQECQKIRLYESLYIEKKIEALSKKFGYNIPE